MSDVATTSPQERTVLKSALQRAREIEGRGTTLVSLYVPPGKQFSDVVGRLRKEMAAASNIKSRATRQAVTGSLQEALTLIHLAGDPLPPNGVAVFADGSDGVCITPPVPMPSLYRCDSKFVLEPLEAVLESKQVYGLVVVDRKEASIGLLQGTRVTALKNLQSLVPQKVNRGGQSQARIGRQADNAVTEWLGTVGEAANALFMPRLDKLSGILVGGPGSTKDQWLIESKLDYRLRTKVHPTTFTTGYTDEYQGLKELVAAAGSSLEGLEAPAEAKLVERFMEAVHTGRATYGVEAVRDAEAAGRVETVLVSEDFEYVTESPVVVISTNSEAGKQFSVGFKVGALLRW